MAKKPVHAIRYTVPARRSRGTCTRALSLTGSGVLSSNVLMNLIRELLSAAGSSCEARKLGWGLGMEGGRRWMGRKLTA